MTRPTLLALTLLWLGVAALCHAEHVAVRRAEQAIAAGNVVPERDLKPLLNALRRARHSDEKRQLVNAIANFGEARGDSPNAVKSYLLEG